jgi:glycosyltransferase involved in cell wall biosynthesis
MSRVVDGKLPVTVVVPVKNDATSLRRSLPNLNDFQHVIVVDSNSSDDAAAAASDHGADFILFSWDGRFPKKRNWVLRTLRFSTPWVLFLDADELVTSEFVAELRSVLPVTKCKGFWIQFDNHFLGRELKHGNRMSKLCLFRIGAAEYEFIEEDRWSTLDMEVHEHPIVNGICGRIKTPLIHDDARSLHSHFEKHNEYSSWEANRYIALQDSGPEVWEKLTPRQKWKYKHVDRWWLAPAYFLADYLGSCGFIDGRAGLHFALFKMFYFWQIRLKIMEKRRRTRPEVSGARLERELP